EDTIVFALDVSVEEKLGTGRTSQPAILGDLGFQLAGAPAGITERHQRVTRAAARRYGAQYIDRRGQTNIVGNGQRRFHAVIARMQDKAAAAVDRPAVAHDEI